MDWYDCTICGQTLSELGGYDEVNGKIICQTCLVSENKKGKFEVLESRLGEDDVVIAVGLTEEEAEKLVAENPKIRIAVPSIINGS